MQLHTSQNGYMNQGLQCPNLYWLTFQSALCHLHHLEQRLPGSFHANTRPGDKLQTAGGCGSERIKDRKVWQTRHETSAITHLWPRGFNQVCHLPGVLRGNAPLCLSHRQEANSLESVAHTIPRWFYCRGCPRHKCRRIQCPHPQAGGKIVAQSTRWQEDIGRGDWLPKQILTI